MLVVVVCVFESIVFRFQSKCRVCCRLVVVVGIEVVENRLGK